MSALQVIFESREMRELDRELKQLDDRLFMDPEMGKYGMYYTVKFWNGERAPNPVTVVVDWREQNDFPKPLTDQIVVEVKRMMQRGPISVESIAAHNAELKREREEQSQRNYRDIVSEFERRDGMVSLLPRSQSLRMARARARRRGEKV